LTQYPMGGTRYVRGLLRRSQHGAFVFQLLFELTLLFFVQHRQDWFMVYTNTLSYLVHRVYTTGDCMQRTDPNQSGSNLGKIGVACARC